MLNLSNEEIKQLTILSAQLNTLLGRLGGTMPGGGLAAGCSGSCEGQCSGCSGCKGGCQGCDFSSSSGAIAQLSVDDLVRVFNNLDTLGTVVLSPEVLNQALLRK